MIIDRLLETIPVNFVPKSGSSLTKKLSRMGLKTFYDLLLHLPTRYEDRTKLCPIGQALPGMIVTVQGEILSSSVIFGTRRVFTCRLRDNSGILTLKFFHFNAAIKNSLVQGRLVSAYGKIRHGFFGDEIVHPEYHVLNRRSQSNTVGILTPVYASTEGVQQSTIRNVMNRALKVITTMPVPELLPPEKRKGAMSLVDALQTLHRPSSKIALKDLELGAHPAQRRIIFEELLAYNLVMLAIKEKLKKNRALPLRGNDLLSRRFLSSLSFSLTKAQCRVAAEIEQDLSRNVPMMRLLQGDVGSGKTLIAALAALRAISSSFQVALMAPTELLAEQHAYNFRNWFTPLGIEVCCLTGKQKKEIRQTQRQAISDGRISMIIGTHAIFQHQIHYSELALVMIDEQHRFGVYQRLALLEKNVLQGFQPHQLIMTATPIPRTLAMTLYANLDSSIINELPASRKPITTVVVPNTRRKEVINRVREACLIRKCQAYWVCTLIEESTTLEAQAAESIWRELKYKLPEIKVGLLHGRMSFSEKQNLMHLFKTGKVQLLVSTTVIEVGVDVPNASLIIIENPERLGLAQLHQLRGRVGRSNISSYCVLLYQSPLNKIASLRLQTLRNYTNGFIIAQKDLEIRGPGELLGTRQAGNFGFRIADLLRDQKMIQKSKKLAQYIMQYHPHLAHALIRRWAPKHIFFHLFQNSSRKQHASQA